MDWIFNWDKVGNLPPVRGFLDWFLSFGLWDWGIFAWLGQHAPFQDRLPLFFLTAVVILGIVSELIWWRVKVMRAKQIGWDERAAKVWQTGPNQGQTKAKPIDLKGARARQISWRLVGLPFALGAIGMWVFFLFYPQQASWQLFAMLWFILTPVRKVWGMWVARKAFRVTDPDYQITSTLLQDVHDYYRTGIAGASSRTVIEPGFETNTWFGRRANWVQVNVRPKTVFSFIVRACAFSVWGVLGQLILAWLVPISAVVAPFWYMTQTEDYRHWMRPWWRWSRSKETPNRVVKGTVVSVHDDTSSSHPLS